MPDFESQDERLARKLTSEGSINYTEKQGATFQREYVVQAVEMQRQGKIHGLLSLDEELSRSFSSKPLEDPFAVTRRHYPLGDAGTLPRRMLYYVERDGTWRAVLVLMEHELPERAPRALEVEPLSGGSRTLTTGDTARVRQPDLARVSWELDPKTAELLRANDFRVLPKPPTELFREVRDVARVRDALAAHAVLPPDAFKGVRGVTAVVTDWNLDSLSVTPGGKWASHVLKGRNTMIAVVAGTFEEFGIVPVHGAPVSTVLRDILVPYEGTVVEAVLRGPEGATTATFDAQRLLRDTEWPSGTGGPPEKGPHPELAQVERTRTRFTRPRAFVSIVHEGVFDAAKGTIVNLNGTVRLPPQTVDRAARGEGVWRRAKPEPFRYRVQQFTQAADGRLTPTGAFVELGPEAFERAARLADDFRAISTSIDRILPEEILVVLKKVK